MGFKVRIKQVFRAERIITIDLDTPETEGHDGAVEQVRSGAIDVPDFEDPRWKTDWKLRSEEVERGS